MRQGILIAIGGLLLVGILVMLNAITFVQKEKIPDREANPNRSTYNTGATGTNAFYTFLAETGRNVVRWPEPPVSLLTARRRPAVFVIVGQMKRDITKTNADALMQWVANGGRLVVIDRDPPDVLVRTSGNWKLTVNSVPIYEIFSADPSDAPAMTMEAPAVKPSQPGIYARSINAVQPSRFAGSVGFERLSNAELHPFYQDLPPDPSADVGPTVHLARGEQPLLVDVPYGSGKIVYLADPFVISNGGLALVDNARLGANLVATNGLVAFDEYHHGYGSGSNRFLEFFAGTPVVPLLLQGLFLIAVVFYSQSRRFARPVPESEPDRLSKLEYVSAMAELQLRTRAFDLAVENIYGDFRRRVSRQLGISEAAPNADTIARALAERLGEDQGQIRSTLLRCEAIIYGDATTKSETLSLAVQLRELEGRLNLRRGDASRL